MSHTATAELPRLRRASAADVLLYFEWANDADVRTSSFNSGVISIEDHRAWFERKLSSPTVLMLVLECGGPVGQIRFEIDQEIAVIGFSLAAAARGRGLGSYLLRMGVLNLQSAHPRVRVVRGLVKPDNAASCRAFEAAGFRLVSQDSDASVPALTYDLELAPSNSSTNSA